MRDVVISNFNSLMLEVTSLCHLKCITCPQQYRFGKEMDKGYVDLNMAKKVVDEVSEYVKAVDLTGLGESLLYPHLIELAEYITSKHQQITVCTATNACLPNTLQIIDALSTKPHFRLGISIDGCGRVFENIRVGADYDVFINNLGEIMNIAESRKIDVTLNMVLLKDNFFQIPEVIEVMKRFDVKNLYLNTVNLVSNDWNLSYYDFYHSKIFLKKIGEAKLLAEKELVNLSFYPPNFDKGMKGSFQNCSAVWDRFYVTWDGYLVPCCAKPFPKIKNFGNVFDAGLMSCINDSEFIHFRKMWNENTVEDFCQRCHMVN